MEVIQTWVLDFSFYLTSLLIKMIILVYYVGIMNMELDPPNFKLLQVKIT